MFAPLRSRADHKVIICRVPGCRIPRSLSAAVLRPLRQPTACRFQARGVAQARCRESVPTGVQPPLPAYRQNSLVRGERTAGALIYCPAETHKINQLIRVTRYTSYTIYARWKSDPLLANLMPRMDHAPLFQLSSTVRSDSCSALLIISRRFHATGSIRLLISRSTQSRRSFGSMASSSQQRSP
jgi:hypothetical protein